MNYIKKLLTAGIIVCSISSCINDLNRDPFYDLNTSNVYKDFSNYKSVLAKLYAGYAVTGQSVVDKPDMKDIDAGESNYLRAYWQVQELTTDEAVIGWNNATLQDLHNMNWTSGNSYTKIIYERIYYQVALTNEFIRETSDSKLNERGITGTQLTEAKQFRAEARFLRALSYWHALDLFGNAPFITETTGTGSLLPKQGTRKEIFDYIESELLAIESELVNARANEYGRADKAAAWTLLAKLYLNAEVYIGQAKYTEAVTYAKKVIDAGYTLESEYANLFLADNHKSKEIIFPIAFDGLQTQSYGGTCFLVRTPIGGSMNPAEFGVQSGWGGTRTTQNVVDFFTNSTDERALFHTSGQSKEINSVTTFTDGYPITKYKNITSSGLAGADPSGTFPDTDYPMFRLADVYLMYAEATLRGGNGGDRNLALNYVNLLQERAYDNTMSNLNSSQLTLDFIIKERARELNWEAHRRTDLIRFGLFTSGAYVWAWKGGTKEGKGVENYRTLFPIPASDLIANPNLKQNQGY